MEIIKLIAFGLFRFKLYQTKWGRKWHGGKFYYMQTNLPMAAFWDDVKFTNCQAKCLKEEEYGNVRI